MTLENKKIFINNLKIKLEELIKHSLNELPIDFDNITLMINNHYDFINFIESMKIYEDYKWERIKEEYNKIKKKVNIDNKLCPQIIKIYGIVNSYYSLEEFNIKNNIINKLSKDNNLLKLEWIKIKTLHNILINKRKNYIKNNSIIKIFIKNDKIEKLIDKLNDVYYNLKKLKNKN
jgi:hypothetical protein